VADVTRAMRSDWNRRALEDANYYVAFGCRGQGEEEFQKTATDVVRGLEHELRHLGGWPEIAAMRALEIGCGPGRLMLPLSRRFREVHGVDISEEMIRLARVRLRDIPNAHPQVNSGADLAGFADASFDFVYSYAVFQHIPSRDVVFSYLSEACRVLRIGGLLWCQINGLPESATPCDTWSGIGIKAGEITRFAQENDLQLLALVGAGTQYTWATMRKQPRGWHADLARRRPATHASVRRVSNTFSSEPLAPCRGRFASISLWIEALPAECDLLHLEATIGSQHASAFYIGPLENDGLRQVNISLPPGIETGLHPVLLLWLGEPLCPPATLRVVPPGPLVPRVTAVSDAIDLLSGASIRCGVVRIVLEEVEEISAFQACVDGQPASQIETLLVDPVAMRYEINIHLPSNAGPGDHSLEMRLGRRLFSPFKIQIVHS
jgi:SAM-dependent methyltransferase